MASSASSAPSRGRAGGLRAERFGSEVPRIFTPPLRELTPETSLGFAVIDFAVAVLGVRLRPWQEWFCIHALELLPDGHFRFRTVMLSVARQNGKSTLSQVLALFFMYVYGARLVIGTAQNLDISEEVWDGAVDLAEGVDELAELIAPNGVKRSNGKKALVLDTGERYRVQPATRRGGRGLSGDFIMLDELREHHSWEAWSAVTKTTMARPDALILGMSNAGDAASIVLRHIRLMAHRLLGDPDGIVRAAEGVQSLLGEGGEDAPDDAITRGDAALGWFEWSAPPECDIWDVEGWLWANPSYGHVEMHRALESAAATDPEWEFRTECLCQWNDGATESVFPGGSWLRGQEDASGIAGNGAVTYCVEVEPDLSRSFVVAAGLRGDGDVHVEVVAASAGTAWVTGWFTDRADPEAPIQVVCRRRGAQVGPIADDLEQIEGVDVIDWGGKDFGGWCGRLYTAVAAHLWEPDPSNGDVPDVQPVRLWHRPQPALDIVAATVVTRPLAGGDSWVWSATGSPYGCAPLMAASGAVGSVLQPREDTSSAYEWDTPFVDGPVPASAGTASFGIV